MWLLPCQNIMKYLQSEAREKQQAAFQKGWKITIIKVTLTPDLNPHAVWFAWHPENHHTLAGTVDVSQMAKGAASFELLKING